MTDWDEVVNALTWGMIAAILFFLALIMFMSSGCSRKVNITLPVTVRADYSYRTVKREPETFAVWVRNSVAEKAAVAELCSASYVCERSEGGRIFFVERNRK